MNESVKQYLSEIGKIGGSRKTVEKQRAARINGRKGGRPRVATSYPNRGSGKKS